MKWYSLGAAVHPTPLGCAARCGVKAQVKVKYQDEIFAGRDFHLGRSGRKFETWSVAHLIQSQNNYALLTRECLNGFTVRPLSKVAIGLRRVT